MNKLTPKGAFRKLASIYKRMSDQYADSAAQAGLSCEGCTDNCCYSFFQHHTYIEWAYLWEGLKALPQEKQDYIVDRCKKYVEEARIALQKDEKPHIMCPLNLVEDGHGKCGLYEHRLMICRMHGVPNMLQRPDGRKVEFPGCWRMQEIAAGTDQPIPVLDRTKLYKELAMLEMQFVGKNLPRMPRVDHTIAEMIVLGPPTLR